MRFYPLRYQALRATSYLAQTTYLILLSSLSSEAGAENPHRYEGGISVGDAPEILRSTASAAGPTAAIATGENGATPAHRHEGGVAVGDAPESLRSAASALLPTTLPRTACN